MSYKENWIPLVREVHSCVYSQMVNRGYADAGVVPDATRPIVAAIRFTLKNVGVNGTGEVSEVDQIEDAITHIEPELRSDCSAVFVGRIRGGGRSDFMFYVPEKQRANFESAVKEGLAAFGVSVVAQSDPKWKTYLGMLPTPPEMRVFQDALVVNQLAEHGDPLTSKRDVIHFLYFPLSKQQEAEACAKILRQDGFTVKVDKGVQTDQISVRANRDDSVTMDAISPITRRMVELAEQFGGEYDGWEAMFVKPKGVFGKLFGG